MTVLISFICITLAGATAAAAFVFGRQVGYTKHENEIQRGEIQAMQAQIDTMQMEYAQLETQYKQDMRDNRRPVRPGAWDPGELSVRG